MNDANAPRAGDDISDNQPALPPTWLGWAVRLFSLVLLALLVGVLVKEATAPTRPITFETVAKTDEIRRDGETWLVPIEVTNRGTRTAQMVHLVASNGAEERPIEILMIGENKSMTFVLGFASPPGKITTRIESYQTP